jgi:phosphopantothenoylcysteine decarboxylase/phosphopantothenate--cysteine ligase
METEDGVANARKKLKAKQLDLIVLNDLTVQGAGFGVDTNVVSLIDQRGKTEALPRMSKIEVADRILDWVARRWQ